MAYRAYTTNAFVVTSFNRVGSDQTVLLFTEDAGMVYARAIGVREEKSKLRYALQPLSFVRVSLVRGKREWRLIGADPEENLFPKAGSREARAAIVRAVRLLARLVRGEEGDARLFALFRDGILLVVDDPSVESEKTFALRMLAALGYIADERLTPLSRADTLSDAVALLSRVPGGIETVERRIDEALAASHL